MNTSQHICGCASDIILNNLKQKSKSYILIKRDKVGIFRFFIVNKKTKKEEMIGGSLFIQNITIEKRVDFTTINFEVVSFKCKK